jgi:Uma2 family endonuclease
VRTGTPKRAVEHDDGVRGAGARTVCVMGLTDVSAAGSSVAELLPGGSSLCQPMTYAEYLRLGEGHHDEYYDGARWVNPPSRRHAQVVARLTRLLQDALPPGHDVLSEWGWQIAPRAVCEPDIMVFPSDAPGDDLLRAAPLLVVEVTSRSTRSEDWGRKRELYAQGGAAWYWIVDPDAHEVTVMRLEAGGFNISRELRDRVIHEFDAPVQVTLSLDALFG